ncbi:MAG: hypothetical protein PHY26_00385 [Bacilli bacterium]|jgi:hypothetical protein|nr:hypothetical protein [Bacilli bacterium]
MENLSKKITLKDFINYCKYEKIDVNNLLNKIQIASTGESIYSTKEKPILATTFTFSCTNLLIYCDQFAYLYHIDPAVTTGIKKTLPNEITEFINYLKNYPQISNLNILIVLGISSDKKQKRKFHNLRYLYEQLKIINNYAIKQKIKIHILPTQKSEHIIFDYLNQQICLNNTNNIFIHINNLIDNNSLQKNI